MKTWNVYCSGEIHTNWRKLLNGMVVNEGLPIQFTSPNCNHEESDAVGDILEPVCEEPIPEAPFHYGENDKKYFFRGVKSAKINQTRIQSLIKECDFAVVTFGIGGEEKVASSAIISLRRSNSLFFITLCHLCINSFAFIIKFPKFLKKYRNVLNIVVSYSFRRNI